MHLHRLLAPAPYLVAAFTVGCGDARLAVDSGSDADVVAIMRAEDGRPADDALGAIARGLNHPEPRVVRVAVRALGRLERPTLVDRLMPFAGHLDPGVRAEAANALAQSVTGSDAATVRAFLLRRAQVERDPMVRGVLARSLGRLATSPGEDLADRARAIAALGAGEASAVLGAMLGLYHLARASRGAQPAPGGARDWVLMHLFGEGGVPADHPDSDRIRRLAAATLALTDGVDEATARRAFGDPDGEVRRHTLGMASSESVARALREDALDDASPGVRIAALQALGADGAAVACRAGAALARDSVPTVAMAALTLLAGPCPASAGAVEALVASVGELERAPAAWHVPARALVSLASLAPARARTSIPSLVGHESPFARVYAVRAAGRMGDRDVVRLGLEDEDDNVRAEAVLAWGALRGHAGDAEIRAQLDREDPRLLMNAASLLRGAPDADAAVDALFSAFQRVSARKREPERDARLALLESLAGLGGARLEPRIRPYVSDFDPIVAARVAELASRWSGEAVEPHPQPLPAVVFPSPEEMERLRRRNVVLELDGGDVEILLLPDLAPTNVARMARLAGAGYFDGLTFHRVVPNFVVQGGSPGANEYAGAARYSRDEVGLESHWRGSVGLSTRGRDTGDAQIFINTVDNPRLDHTYTVFGVVVRGMDLVDRVLEGTVIRRARLVERVDG